MFLKAPSRLSTVVLRIVSFLGFTELTIHPHSGTILEATNLTIFNCVLVKLGPMTEKRLVQTLIAIQVSRTLFFSFEENLLHLTYSVGSMQYNSVCHTLWPCLACI